jgi:O-antigen ligase
MRSPAPHPAAPSEDSIGRAFAGCFGLLLGIGLLKFGNPVILGHLVELPRSLIEWRVFAWPHWIGQIALAAVAVLGLFAYATRRHAPSIGWPAVVLGFWLAWQLLAGIQSIDPPVTRVVLFHFASCAVCFLLGMLALGRIADPRVFWLCLMMGFVGILATAFEQRMGGLEATRKMILHGDRAAELPPEYLARIRSNRVFSTLVYPNALAGALLLLLPVACVLAGRLGLRRGVVASRLLGGGTLVAGLMVLVWSGSKAGWLLAMAIGVFLVFQSPVPKAAKVALAAILVVSGLTAFGFVFAEKLRRGPTSLAARFDYWAAAFHGFKERPFLGNGPGAFKRVYARVKRPESEMAQLAHNDYLQQATDSGVVGSLTYATFVAGSLGHLYRQRAARRDPLQRAIWLGLAGWFTQGLVEFGLYIPATAWCAFALLGWLLGIDLPAQTGYTRTLMSPSATGLSRSPAAR